MTDHALTRPPAEIRRATAVGGIAIVLWSTLALFATLAAAIPPFQLVAMSFGIAFVVGTAAGAALGRDVVGALRQPPAVWLLGVGGLFGYHFFYFLAFQLAPGAAVEVNLLNYLWPLLIVLFSALLPGERLRRGHVLGALAGLAGTALIVLGRGTGGVSVEAANLPGYLSAATCAVTWAAYSVLSRRFGDVPTEAVGGFCLATSILSGLCHLLFETTAVPTGTEWLIVILMGIGPVGAAFFVWDHGVKRGDIRALGALSYATPLLSTFLLILFGDRAGGWSVWVACALIIGGAVLASRDVLRR
ncbi:EamA family transporter [Azospirillum sp. RWY-5-1]|uniref:EamA family transporter n=1 Tax=Azospirillum oleiclasticum TaxID=2735135 RepID=A0ABX2T2X4_9PROT|nr:EamA family transporter [Azospirillum oleiclasticum]NYZ11495.1 EamA family transporter [Azospirillum oleiclasticum]NYZ18656.1 EamA family transporter [Azospirillum oleiclasticum]